MCCDGTERVSLVSTQLRPDATHMYNFHPGDKKVDKIGVKLTKSNFMDALKTTATSGAVSLGVENGMGRTRSSERGTTLPFAHLFGRNAAH